LLRFRRPSIYSRAKLNQAALPQLGGVVCHPFWRNWIDNGIARRERVLSGLFERGVHPQHRARTAIRAGVSALCPNVYGVFCESLLFELGCLCNAPFQGGGVDSHFVIPFPRTGTPIPLRIPQILFFGFRSQPAFEFRGGRD
jgi:hypothetical protein